jgi:hypothetical protein
MVSALSAGNWLNAVSVPNLFFNFDRSFPILLTFYPYQYVTHAPQQVKPVDNSLIAYQLGKKGGRGGRAPATGQRLEPQGFGEGWQVLTVFHIGSV